MVTFDFVRFFLTGFWLVCIISKIYDIIISLRKILYKHFNSQSTMTNVILFFHAHFRKTFTICSCFKNCVKSCIAEIARAHLFYNFTNTSTFKQLNFITWMFTICINALGETSFVFKIINHFNQSRWSNFLQKVFNISTRKTTDRIQT